MGIDLYKLSNSATNFLKKANSTLHETIANSENPVNSAKLTSALDGLATINTQLIKGESQTKAIHPLISSAPKEFKSINGIDEFLDKYVKSTKRYSDNDIPYYTKYNENGCFSSFKKEIETGKLKEIKIPVKSIDISNFKYPNGSIAIPARLDETISTSGLLQCCAVSFVDKKHNLQTLLHLCPTINKKDNEDLINYILDASNPEDLEISVVPGCDKTTDKTIRFFMDTLKRKIPDPKVNFFSFPDKHKSIVILNQGKLCTIDRLIFKAQEVNPENRILHA